MCAAAGMHPQSCAAGKALSCSDTGKRGSWLGHLQALNPGPAGLQDKKEGNVWKSYKSDLCMTLWGTATRKEKPV